MTARCVVCGASPPVLAFVNNHPVCNDGCYEVAFEYVRFDAAARYMERLAGWRES